METDVRAKQLAWVVIGVLACGFCYSIGFQFGDAHATRRASDRLEMFTEQFEYRAETAVGAGASGPPLADADAA